jgi:hypothetical protein
MSPTSYQTAPPRIYILTQGTHVVKFSTLLSSCILKFRLKTPESDLMGSRPSVRAGPLRYQICQNVHFNPITANVPRPMVFVLA